MPLGQRSKKIYNNFDIPLSYKINDDRERFLDCSNVFSNQGRLETRNGTSRFNANVIGDGSKVLSISYFKNNSGTIIVFAKVGTSLYLVSETGTHTELKSGLTSTTKHRGLTLNNRHIISIEADGLFQYDSTNGFTQLGQAVPSAPTTALGSSAGSLTDGDWRVKLTFYSSTTGFETNASDAGTVRTTSSPNSRVELSDIPTTAANATIDKVRIYASIDSGSYLFAAEISLGTATYNLDDDPTSSSTPPTTHDVVQSGGGKFLTEFNRKLVYAGNDTFKNDVFFSEQDLPDAYDTTTTQLILYASGNGPITGLATGFFNDSNLDPYLVIFKRNKIMIYSEIAGTARFSVISITVGCISHDTIEIRNGDVFFMSERGWHAIIDGKLIKDKNGNVLTLGNGDIDDIFTVGTGYENEINLSNEENFHSIYYPALDQYITFISETGNTDTKKAYVFEFSTSKGFKVYNFPMNMSSSAIAENSNKQTIVLLGDEFGRIYKHSIAESKTDVDQNNNLTMLNAYAILSWFQKEDFSTTYNFRDVMVQGVGESGDVTLKAYINYTLSASTDKTLGFTTPEGGFVLDVSQLDVDSFGDSRAADVVYADINKAGESLAIGFFQNVIDGRMSIIKAQVDFNKNGNRN